MLCKVLYFNQIPPPDYAGEGAYMSLYTIYLTRKYTKINTKNQMVNSFY